MSSKNVYERLGKFGKNYAPSSIYAVTRTADWISNWKNVCSCAMNIAGEHEILYEMYSIISGKRKIHKRVCLIRSNEHGTLRSGDKSIEGINLAYYWRNNLLNKSNLVSNIVKNSNVSLTSKNIFHFFEDYTNIKNTNENLTNIKKYIREKLSNINIFYNLFSYYNISNGNKFRDLENSDLFFKKHNLLIDIEDMKIVNETIESFNKTEY